MSNENPNDKNPKKLQYNTYWIYGLIIFFVLAVNALAFINNKTESVNTQEFVKMAQENDIKEVLVINNNFAKIFIKKEKLEKYNITENSFNAEQPHFTMEIGDVGKFEERLDGLIGGGADFVFDYKKEINWMGQLMGWIFPILLLVGLWVFFMRRMSGGAGGPGAQIFNIGKSKATLF